MFITKKIKGRIVKYKQCSMIHNSTVRFDYDDMGYCSYEAYITDCIIPERSHMMLEHIYLPNYDYFYKLMGVEVEYQIKGEKKNACFDTVYSYKELFVDDEINLSYNKLTHTITVIEDI